LSLNWREFEETVRSLVPDKFSLEGDSYGWVGERRPASVKRIALTLDLYRGLDYSSYDVVISHHAPLFTPDFPVFVVHSALDRVDWGCHFSLAKVLGLEEIEFLEDRRGCIGRFSGSEGELLFRISEVLNVKHLRFYFTGSVESVAVFSGCGLNYFPFIESALKAGADVLIYGDLTHHKACFLKFKGVGFVDAGHRGAELPGLREFSVRLREYLEVDLIDGEEFYSYLCLC